jgi:hypothetical protein
MKKAFNKFMQMMGMLSAAGISPEAAKAAGIKIARPRFVAGDRFYQHLQYKRVNGKWKVRK